MELLNFQSFLNVINNDGKKINTPIIANIIAIAVNIPNITVGIKLENVKIENPKAIVIEVVNTANPALILVKFIESLIMLFFLNSVKRYK